MENKNIWIIVAVVVVIVGLVFYYLNSQGILKYKQGQIQGQRQGYSRGQNDLQNAQGVAAQKAAEKAAEKANPFKVDPYASVKDALNPFK